MRRGYIVVTTQPEYWPQETNEMAYYPQVTYQPQFLQGVLGVVITVALIIIIGGEVVRSLKGIF